MSDIETPGWFSALVGVVAVVAGLWGLWCTVIAFTGGTMPILGVQTDGGVGTGLLMLFFGTPILMTLAYWASMIVLMPIGLLFSRRAR